MELTNATYVVIKSTIKELLDDVDSFKRSMDKFNEKHNNPYKYNIDIYSDKTDGKMYVAELNVTNNE